MLHIRGFAPAYQSMGADTLSLLRRLLPWSSESAELAALQCKVRCCNIVALDSSLSNCHSIGPTQLTSTSLILVYWGMV